MKLNTDAEPEARAVVSLDGEPYSCIWAGMGSSVPSTSTQFVNQEAQNFAPNRSETDIGRVCARSFDVTTKFTQHLSLSPSKLAIYPHYLLDRSWQLVGMPAIVESSGSAVLQDKVAQYCNRSGSSSKTKQQQLQQRIAGSQTRCQPFSTIITSVPPEQCPSNVITEFDSVGLNTYTVPSPPLQLYLTHSLNAVSCIQRRSSGAHSRWFVWNIDDYNNGWEILEAK
ncbi:uncharacterized protein ARMOST_20102 [Armillaria ostoyae]|uniref:Uncharacterized protein n=1 Tax=Armillaria ostoyae TaxID=47428 RepID=A0A284S6I8_ARMOS|nr:uncharacterized protein ARMOST_20102 [Armillaria ostoyae]